MENEGLDDDLSLSKVFKFCQEMNLKENFKQMTLLLDNTTVITTALCVLFIQAKTCLP